MTTEAQDEPVAPIVLPEIPTTDLSFDLSSVIGAQNTE